MRRSALTGCAYGSVTAAACGYSASVSHGRMVLIAPYPVSLCARVSPSRAHDSIDAGDTMPGGGVVSLKRKVNKRSDTIRPLTDSAGYVAQNPSAPTFLPPAVAMFHI